MAELAVAAAGPPSRQPVEAVLAVSVADQAGAEAAHRMVERLEPAGPVELGTP